MDDTNYGLLFLGAAYIVAVLSLFNYAGKHDHNAPHFELKVSDLKEKGTGGWGCAFVPVLLGLLASAAYFEWPILHFVAVWVQRAFLSFVAIALVVAPLIMAMRLRLPFPPDVKAWLWRFNDSLQGTFYVLLFLVLLFVPLDEGVKELRWIRSGYRYELKPPEEPIFPALRSPFQ